jgi:predicted transcriptional regulator
LKKGLKEKDNLEIDEFLSSKVRIRILKLLFDLGELNATRICKRVRANYSVMRNHLSILEKMGFIQHKKFGRMSFYRLNDENPRVKVLKRLFEVWQTK